MPHRIYGEHQDYLWQMPATASWENAYRQGQCNEVQSAFWRPKPTEELYDEHADPYEIHNLADRPEQQSVLVKLRGLLHDQLLRNRDAGLLPEADMLKRAGGQPIYAMTHDDARYPVSRILETADVASGRDVQGLHTLMERMKDSDSAVRYWAAVGCSVRGENAKSAITALRALCADPSPSVRVAADEALVRVGEPSGLDRLVRELDTPDCDALAALDSLTALGERAVPATVAIQARIKKGLPGTGRANGDSGARLIDLAAADLLTVLGTK